MLKKVDKSDILIRVHKLWRYDMRRWIKILLIVLGVLILICAGLVAWLYTSYKSAAEDPSKAFKDNGSSVSIEGADVQQTTEVVDGTGAVRTPVEESVNILLLGIDSNVERVKLNKGYRSDMMMVLNINFKDNKVHMLAIPRDTKVEMNHLDYQTGEVTSQTTNKINAAYAFGGGPKHFGAQNAMDCTRNFLSCSGRLSIPIDYYFSIDIDGITKICDALDGVEVTLNEDFYKMTLEEGSGSKTLDALWGRKGETITLKGDSAETFVRQRHSGGINQRMSRQQQFLMAVAKKIKDMGAIEAAPKIFNEVLSYAQTNLTLDQVMSLAAFLDDLQILRPTVSYSSPSF